MIKQKDYLIFTLTIILTAFGFAQKPINQLDKDGKRHGLWTKNYHKTDQKRYEGNFNHGKEIDTFNYYTLSNGKSVLSAIKVFNEKDSIAEVTFYTSNKNIISEGRMDGKKYVGQWTYYHKDSPAKMIVEHYNNDGQLDGERTVFYKNGNVAESTSYHKGKLDGASKWFSEDNKLLRQSLYKNDQLNGKTINYDSDGNITSRGDFTNDQKSGIWKYYNSGKITKEVDHTTQKVIKKYE